MAIDLAAAKAHLNVTKDDDDAVITRLVSASAAHLGRQLGFAIDDADVFPDGTPADLEQAQLLVIGHWFENREQTITGTIITQLPMGVQEIIAEYRTFSFGVTE